MTGQKISVVLVGIGGYGELYLSALLDELRGSQCHIVGVVDPKPENCSRLDDLSSLGVPLFTTLDEFYGRARADLAVLSSPIHCHVDHTCAALANGSHVLVEKPAAASTSDVDRMIAARDRAGLIVAVGFQWSFSRSILELKRDIMSGRFGAPRTARSLALWPRTEGYYARNDWAGRKRDAGGRWILDSPANNAMAHFLHNLLFLLGEKLDRSAIPGGITAHLARANDIEMFDTIGARVFLERGVELLFLASHAIARQETCEPMFCLEFDEALIEFPGDNAPITARLNNGTTVAYDSPNATPQSQKLWDSIDAITRTCDLPCGLETARPHTQCIEMIEQAGTSVVEFDTTAIQQTDTNDGQLRWVPGLAAKLRQAYSDGVLPELTDVR
ncbi:MAG: Gfo/Idh/MocA family oxidoreductase [Gemmatimonadota bacterium]|nr:MAG: Gfo/Idh/MocA family oxidoreductase [Gemmatimonadota bacterium]